MRPPSWGGNAAWASHFVGEEEEEEEGEEE